MKTDLREARLEFAERRLRWSLAESEREIREDYRLLKRQRSFALGRTLGYLESIPVANRRLLGVASAKDASGLFRRDQLGENEVWALDHYTGSVYSKNIFEPVALVDRKMAHSKEEVKSFRTKLVKAIVSELGQKPVRGSGVNPLIVKNIGEWALATDVDFGARHEPQVKITQRFNRRDAKIGEVSDNALLKPYSLGLAESLGLGVTEWGLFYYEHLDEIIEPVLEEIRYMLAPLPEWIEGLDI